MCGSTGGVCHEHPQGNYAYGGSGRQESHIEGAVFQDLLFDRNCRRDGRLVVRFRLGHGHGYEMAVGLVQMSDELNNP